MREVWSPRAPFLGRYFEMKSSPRLSDVVRPGCERAKLCPQEEGSGVAVFRAARPSAASRRDSRCGAVRCGAVRCGAVRCGEELRPLRRVVPEEGDPAARANARKCTVTRTQFLRSGCGVIQKHRVHARPGAAHR